MFIGGSSEKLVSRIICKMTVDECLAQISADDVVNFLKLNTGIRQIFPACLHIIKWRIPRRLAGHGDLDGLL